MIIYQIIMIILLNVIVPILIGGLFQTDICKTKVSQIFYRYAVGFFVMLAVYQLLEVPMALMYVKFHVLVATYSVALIVMISVAVWRMKKNGKFYGYLECENKKNRIGVYGWIYFLFFLGVVLCQLYHAIFFQLGEMSLDDAVYVAYANDAVELDMLFNIDPYSGNYTAVNIQRLLQASLIYPSYIARITNIPVAVMEHTLWPVFLIVMAYGVYYVIAERLFKKQENRFLFLFMIALLYNYGYFSHYSTSFRLLGAIWQGKAILAIILNFLYLYIYSYAYSNSYSKKTSCLLFILSVSSVALTLGGVISTMVISCTLFVLFGIKNRCLGNVKYLICSNVMPSIYAIFYLLLR